MTHNLETFLEHLEAHRDQALIFDLGNGQRVPVGYHVTEFKALEYHTVDCGGTEHRFQETVIELWRTALEQNSDSLNVGKFLRIYQKVSPVVTFQPHAELIFLYGKPGEPAARYSVGNLEANSEELIVRLEPHGVRCKSAERKADAVLGQLPVVSGCCSATATAASSDLCC
jgi:hypothetical protein